MKSGIICVTTEADPSLLSPQTAAEGRLSEQLRSKATLQQGELCSSESIQLKAVN